MILVGGLRNVAYAFGPPYILEIILSCKEILKLYANEVAESNNC